MHSPKATFSGSSNYLELVNLFYSSQLLRAVKQIYQLCRFPRYFSGSFRVPKALLELVKIPFGLICGLGRLGELGSGGGQPLLRPLEIFFQELDTPVQGGDFTLGLQSWKTEKIIGIEIAREDKRERKWKVVERAQESGLDTVGLASLKSVSSKN